MISVCMASYNGEAYVGEQLKSILAQLGEEDEVIVSDDGSTDNTLGVIQAIGDRRVKVIGNETGRHGVNANFENALRHASGDIIFLTDQDDVWLPGKVEACLEGLKENDLVVHDAIITDGSLRPTGKSFFETVNASRGALHNWIHNGYLGCAMAFRRKVLATVLPFPEKMPFYHDIWIGTIAGLRYRVAFLDFKGMMFRRHGHTTSITFHRRGSWRQIISNRLAIVRLAAGRLLAPGHPGAPMN